MKNQELEHRDILSGIIATSLAKEGYYGETIRIYGYFYWNEKEITYVCALDEETCAKDAYDKQIEAYNVTSLYTIAEHVSDNQVDNCENILAALSVKLQKKIETESCFLKEKQAEYYPVLWLKCDEKSSKRMREMSGFGYWDTAKAAWEIYSNAFFPATFTKWQQIKEKGCFVTPIYTELYSLSTYVHDAKKIFYEKLQLQLKTFEFTAVNE